MDSEVTVSSQLWLLVVPYTILCKNPRMDFFGRMLLLAVSEAKQLMSLLYSVQKVCQPLMTLWLISSLIQLLDY